ncbi:MAG: nucleoside hydrolase [Spirochaetota bacterium]
MVSSATPVFVDCDNTMGLPRSEIDDGLTILYLLAQPSVSIVGVSATYGNGSVDAVVRQTRRLIHAVGLDVPVCRGREPARIPAGGQPTAGGARLAPAAREAAEPPSEAARALVAAAREHDGRLVVLGLGALTNIAEAGALDPEFYLRLAGIYAMGGYLVPVRFRLRQVRELNFSADPVASFRVLYAPCPVTIASAQLCLAARFGARELIGHNRGPRTLRRIVRRWFLDFSRYTGEPGFYLWDLVPAAAIVSPQRVPRHLVRLRSTTEDLRAGFLHIDELEPAIDAERLDSAMPGIVSLPRAIVGERRFSSECAAAWAAAANEHDFRQVFVRA